MEILGLVIFLLVAVGYFIEAFAAFNLIQFFRGKEITLERLTKKAQKNET